VATLDLLILVTVGVSIITNIHRLPSVDIIGLILVLSRCSHSANTDYLTRVNLP